MRGPTCAELVSDWSSTRADHSEYIFHTSGTIPKGEIAQGLSWGVLFDLDHTLSGKPCLKNCKPGELLRRYAFSVEWYEGHMLTGSVASMSNSKWQLLEGLDGKLLEFFRHGDQLILCTAKGFGAWDHASAKPLWWQDSPVCPLRKMARE
jgi:hypothetical protein